MNHPALASRRQFLNRSAAMAAVSVATPYFIPSGLLGAPGQPGPNDRIAIAGIGIGRQGSGVFQAAVDSKLTRPIAIADANIIQARKMGDRFAAEPYQHYQKVLERKDVDAIITATPDHWRAIVCIHACQAGKDVYAEKPMSLTIREGRLMVEAVRKHQRVFQTGSQQRSMAVNRLACEFVRSGRIGKVRKVIAHNYPSPWECALPSQPVPEGLDWDLWCGPTPVVPYHIDLCTPRARPGWISFRPYSGGESTGWGAHGFDQVQWALGMDESGPIEVWVEGPKFNPPAYQTSETRARGEKICSQPKVFFRYPNDIIMELGDGPAGGATFIGEKGTITIDRDIFKSEPAELAQDAIKAARPPKGDNHMLNWLECIKSRQRPAADVEIGHRSATVCHLVNIARWAGRRLRWDPVKECFPDDPQAKGFLDRPRRKPYDLPQNA